MPSLEEIVCQITGATVCKLGKVIQNLWSGYGVIQKVTLGGLENSQAVIKHVDLSQTRTNARGWTGNQSHRRKVKSYEVETAFYLNFSNQCLPACRIPKLLGVFEKDKGLGRVLVLEDLDAAGFSLRKRNVTQTEVHHCLTWLAEFHATFLGCEGTELWPIGTYWHLETRPEEWEAMTEGALKTAASQIDERLNIAKYQTLVHGDAKLANFCFPDRDGTAVAAVDFQYVGKGCGMKDVAYLISCLGERDAETNEAEYLDFYIQQLKFAVTKNDSPVDLAELEFEWRSLYSFAWADFCRFLAGWSPGHWKMNAFNDRLTQSVLTELGRI
jgi:hypothetical protein